MMQNRAIWIAVGAVAALSVGLIIVSILLSQGSGPADTRTVGTDDPTETKVKPPPPEDDGASGRPKGSLEGTVWTLPDGTTIDLVNENQGMIDCLTENCRTSPSEANFGMCQRRECKLEGQTLTINGEGATLSGGTFTADLVIGGLSGHFASYPVDPIWIGVTLKDGSGKERDLEPIQVAMKDTAKPIHFEAKDVGDGYTSYLVAAWARKRSPCPTPRDGCERYGYALELLLGSYPADAYEGGTLKYAGL